MGRYVRCNECHGSGAFAEEGQTSRQPCPFCKSTGRTWNSELESIEGMGPVETKVMKAWERSDEVVWTGIAHVVQRTPGGAPVFVYLLLPAIGMLTAVLLAWLL